MRSELAWNGAFHASQDEALPEGIVAAPVDGLQTLDSLSSTLQEVRLDAAAGRKCYRNFWKQYGMLVSTRRHACHYRHCAGAITKLAARHISVGAIKGATADLAPGALEEDLEAAHLPVVDGCLVDQPHIPYHCTTQAL